MTASMDAGPLVIPPYATAFGFSLRRSGSHLSRSLMLPELGLLFAAVPGCVVSVQASLGPRASNVLT